MPTASGAMPIAAVINGEQFAVHSDHLNTPRRMTDKDGKVRWQWAYSGFGEVSAQSLTTDSLPERRLNLRYPGQVDDGNGLFYNWHRFYHPATGRYTQSDPIGLAGGLNRFGYVGGNAMGGVDPMGLAPGDVFKTRDDAAVDAGDYARTLNPQFVEYGGWIFPKGDGYSYNLIKGNPGSVPRSKMNDLKQKCPTTPTDAWHTHPDPGDPDSQVNDFSNGDRNFAREQGVPVYLKTPMGPTLVVSPQGASRRVR